MSLTFAGLAKAPTKKTRQEKPFLPDPTGDLTQQVSAGITHKQHIAAHDAALKQCNERLGKAAFAHAAQLYQGRSDVEDTFQIGTAAGKALISLKNDYRKLPEELDAVRELLGPHAGDVLRDSHTIEIDADAIPLTVQQAFIDELVKLAQSLDAAVLGVEDGKGPVFSAISVRQRTCVDRGFHQARWSLLTPEQNARLQQVMPCIISVKYDY